MLVFFHFRGLNLFRFVFDGGGFLSKLVLL